MHQDGDKGEGPFCPTPRFRLREVEQVVEVVGRLLVLLPPSISHPSPALPPSPSLSSRWPLPRLHSRQMLPGIIDSYLFCQPDSAPGLFPFMKKEGESDLTSLPSMPRRRNQGVGVPVLSSQAPSPSCASPSFPAADPGPRAASGPALGKPDAPGAGLRPVASADDR